MGTTQIVIFKNTTRQTIKAFRKISRNVHHRWEQHLSKVEKCQPAIQLFVWTTQDAVSKTRTAKHQIRQLTTILSLVSIISTISITLLVVSEPISHLATGIPLSKVICQSIELAYHFLHCNQNITRHNRCSPFIQFTLFYTANCLHIIFLIFLIPLQLASKYYYP